MGIKKHTRTNDKEVYSKLQTLRLKGEVLIDIKQIHRLNRIIRNLNKSNKIIDLKIVGKFIHLRKIDSEDFEVYIKHNRRD